VNYLFGALRAVAIACAFVAAMVAARAAMAELVK
jgi:hypothetical protein